MALADMGNLMRDDAHYFIQTFGFIQQTDIDADKSRGYCKGIDLLVIDNHYPHGRVETCHRIDLPHNLFKRLLQPRVFYQRCIAVDLSKRPLTHLAILLGIDERLPIVHSG